MTLSWQCGCGLELFMKGTACLAAASFRPYELFLIMALAAEGGFYYPNMLNSDG